MTTETISTAVTNERTPAWDRLNQQQKAFLTIYLATKDHIRAAREANYPVKRASVLMKSPRIRAALAEAQPVAEVRIQAEQADVIAGLLVEAQRPENTGAARVQAWAKLANIMGIDGGGGSREDGALSRFLQGIAQSVAHGAFAGVQAGVTAGVGVPGVVAAVPLEAAQSPGFVGAVPLPVAARVLPLPDDNDLPF